MGARLRTKCHKCPNTAWALFLLFSFGLVALVALSVYLSKKRLNLAVLGIGIVRDAVSEGVGVWMWGSGAEVRTRGVRVCVFEKWCALPSQLLSITSPHPCRMAPWQDFLQVLSIFASFEFEWPPALVGLFNALSLASFNLELLAPECR